MTATNPEGVAREGKVVEALHAIGTLQLLPKFIHLRCRLRLELIHQLSDATLRLSRQALKLLKEKGYAPLLAKVFDTESLHLLKRRGFECFNLGNKCIYLLYHLSKF